MSQASQRSRNTRSLVEASLTFKEGEIASLEKYEVLLWWYQLALLDAHHKCKLMDNFIGSMVRRIDVLWTKVLRCCDLICTKMRRRLAKLKYYVTTLRRSDVNLRRFVNVTFQWNLQRRCDVSLSKLRRRAFTSFWCTVLPKAALTLECASYLGHLR